MTSQHRKPLILTAALLFAAAAVTLYSMLEAAAWRVDLPTALFIVWAVSPYFCFFAAGRLLIKLLPASNIAIPAVVIAALMLAFTIYAYIGTSADHSSTYALVFVFVPLYIYIGSFFLLSIALLVSRLMIKRS